MNETNPRGTEANPPADLESDPGLADPVWSAENRLPNGPGRWVLYSLVAAAVVALAVAWRAEPFAAIGLAAVVVVYGLLADIDLATMYLPTAIVAPLATATLAGIAAATIVQNDIGRGLGALATGVVVYFVLLVMHIATPGLGGGDVRLGFPMGLIGGWLGFTAGATSLFVFSFALLGSAILANVIERFIRRSGRAGRKLEFPAGPAMILGSVAGMFAAAPW